MREKYYTISYGYISREQLIKERDVLRAENERLREALKYIVDRGYTGASYVAQQALKEVTKCS